MLADQVGLLQPDGGVDRQQYVQVGLADLQAAGVESTVGGRLLSRL